MAAPELALGAATGTGRRRFECRFCTQILPARRAPYEPAKVITIRRMRHRHLGVSLLHALSSMAQLFTCISHRPVYRPGICRPLPTCNSDVTKHVSQVNGSGWLRPEMDTLANRPGVCQLGVRAHTLESRSGHLPTAAQRARPVASDPMYRKLLVALFSESAHTTFLWLPGHCAGPLGSSEQQSAAPIWSCW